MSANYRWQSSRQHDDHPTSQVACRRSPDFLRISTRVWRMIMSVWCWFNGLCLLFPRYKGFRHYTSLHDANIFTSLSRQLSRLSHVYTVAPRYLMAFKMFARSTIVTELATTSGISLSLTAAYPATQAPILIHITSLLQKTVSTFPHSVFFTVLLKSIVTHTCRSSFLINLVDKTW